MQALEKTDLGFRIPKFRNYFKLHLLTLTELSIVKNFPGNIWLGWKKVNYNILVGVIFVFTKVVYVLEVIKTNFRLLFFFHKKILQA